MGILRFIATAADAFKRALSCAAKERLALLLVLIGATLTSAALAQHSRHLAPDPLKIHNFRSDMILSKDGLLDVTENIQFDFGNNPAAHHRAIKRFIPLFYDDNTNKHMLLFKLLNITDGSGHELHCDVSRGSGDVVIQLTQAGAVASGLQVFRIHYQVRQAVNFIADQPELFWSLIGTQSTFVTENAQALLRLPVAATSSTTPCLAFYGIFQSKVRANVSYLPSGLIQVDAHNLRPGQDLIFGVKMPVGAVILPAIPEKVVYFLTDWYEALIMPVGTVILLSIFHWFFHGRGAGKKVASSDWAPPSDLTPAEVGTLIDEVCDFSDITSTLIDLAARGHLTIEQVRYDGILMLSDKDYLFRRTTPPASDRPLKFHETLFLDAVFSFGGPIAQLSQLRGRFHPSVETITNCIYNQLLAKRYFARNPEVDRQAFINFGVFIIVVGLLCAIFAGSDMRAGSIGFMLSGIVVAFASGSMPVRTALGGSEYNQCMVFKQFVNTAEKDGKIAALVKEDVGVFNRLLPYAMVLGCSDRWVHAFRSGLIEPPSWFVSRSGDKLTTEEFYLELGSSMQTINQCFMSPPAARITTSTSFR